MQPIEAMLFSQSIRSHFEWAEDVTANDDTGMRVSQR